MDLLKDVKTKIKCPFCLEKIIDHRKWSCWLKDFTDPHGFMSADFNNPYFLWIYINIPSPLAEALERDTYLLKYYKRVKYTYVFKHKNNLSSFLGFRRCIYCLEELGPDVHYNQHFDCPIAYSYYLGNFPPKPLLGSRYWVLPIEVYPDDFKYLMPQLKLLYFYNRNEFMYYLK